MAFIHREHHKSAKVGWLRAAVLGANDGILSTSSLIVGVAAAQVSHKEILISGVAGVIAGAMSMAAGEYVSVSSQADTERADLAQEQDELVNNTEYERDELTQIYIDRGLDEKLARDVALQLMKHDALGSHARDELGITHYQIAKPLEAAFASALMFALGGVVPLLVVLLTTSQTNLIITVTATALVSLGSLGMWAAQSGGASKLRGSLRVIFWGAAAMALTAGIGALFGTKIQ
jgi:VIT1/CCC1 family predicted Fe2+/Mn2+ transporter